MSFFLKDRSARACIGFLLALCSAMASTSVYATVSQSPLLLGGGSVPGNLVLVPSVEFPTVISVANLGAYDNGTIYTGYFDSDKCYDYIAEGFTHEKFGYISGEDGGGYFTPVSWMSGTGGSRSCGNRWSGNYLNWATTQTIDPFRKALTGGYRSVDTVNQTILEKATRAGRNSYFDDRTISGNIAALVSPHNSNHSLTSSLYQGPDNSYQRNKTVRLTRNGVHTFYSVRVEVCKPDFLEGNCKQYGSSYKPEGLLQEYADSIRYSVFGYLNIDGNNIDGGVLRAPQDYVGEYRRDPGEPGLQDNLTKEWDPETGVIYRNPHGDPIGNSGVINYINKFGELTNQHKSNDPVSELYYAALRYLRGLPNLNDYSNQGDTDIKKDIFPVITDWVDPIQYSCQKNAILGIGDVYTHEDRNLLPSSDNAFMNLNTYTQKVFDLESINKSASDVFTGRGNSAYIAGLAYFANTQDIRPDDPGKQTVSTYWVDVRENEYLEPKANNQYWLAAKYGGFEVPDGYGFGNPIPLDAWNQSGEELPTGDRRPDNFYVASDAENMVRSLEQAFAQIANEVQSTTASLAVNSSRLETDTALFQSHLNSRFWSGDLQALAIDEENGTVDATPIWSAATKLDALPDVAGRNILTIRPPVGDPSVEGPKISTTGTLFTWAGLSDEQQELLTETAEENDTLAQKRLDYLRGDRSEEMSAEDWTKPFRQRDSRLGDIVNSDPQFVYQQDFGYARLTGWAGDYKAFRSSAAYQARVPMVIVGANDGMLHGFDASVTGTAGGDELFAFVPNGVFHNLLELTEPNYTHRYYVDGTPRVSDAWLGDRWATVAVGSTGAGGRGIFALDVTDVSGKNSMNANRVMWEFTHPKMGYTIGQPAIVALPNQKFGVIVSSGYHDEEPEQGYVWVLDIKDGSIIKEFVIPTKGNLGGPLASDLDFNQVADRIYVADTLGNLWRLDVASASPSSWDIPSSLDNGPLFIARVGGEAGEEDKHQAITAPLASAYNQRGEHMVLFGTGSFYQVGDNEIPSEPPVETFYGIFDTGSPIDGRGELLEQRVIMEAIVNGRRVRAVTDNSLTDEKGWYLDLAWYPAAGGGGPAGERVVARASLRSGRVLFTTMTPADDPCAFGGTSMIMALDLSSGQRLDTYFDVDGDGVLTDGDNWQQEEGDGDSSGIPWSGISDSEDGVIKGVSPMYKWVCYAGSSGAAPKCIQVPGSMREGRQSWREVRNADG